jgi:hypothetical protein
LDSLLNAAGDGVNPKKRRRQIFDDSSWDCCLFLFTNAMFLSDFDFLRLYSFKLKKQNKTNSNPSISFHPVSL